MEQRSMSEIDDAASKDYARNRRERWADEICRRLDDVTSDMAAYWRVVDTSRPYIREIRACAPDIYRRILASSQPAYARVTEALHKELAHDLSNNSNGSGKYRG